MVKAWTSSLSSTANSILLSYSKWRWIFLKIKSDDSFVFYVDDVKKQLDDLNSDATYPLYTWGDCSRAFLSNLDGMCVCVCVYPASTFYKFPRTSFKSHCPPPPPPFPVMQLLPITVPQVHIFLIFQSSFCLYFFIITKLYPNTTYIPCYSIQYSM